MLRMSTPNLAMDQEILDRVQSEVVKTITKVRDNRARMDETNQRRYKIWNCELDKNSYMGRSKVFLAAARATCETWTNAIARDFFPSTDEWYGIEGVENIGDETRADALKSAFDYFFQRHAKLKSDSIPGFRQLVLYGTSPFKLVFKNEELETFGLERKFKDGESVFRRVRKTVKTDYGPRVIPRSLFNFFVWPETALDVQSAEMAFEDIEVTTDHLKKMAKTPMDPKNEKLGMVYIVPDEVLMDGSQRSSRDLFRYRRERLQRMGISQDPSDRWFGKLGSNHRNLTEMYWDTDLDGTGVKSWLLSVVNDFWVVRIQQNPYWHQKKPWLVPRLIRVIDEFYGRGVMEVIERVQYMMNDLVNQALDSVQFELNPITIVDPGMVAYPNSIRTYPGAKWLAQPDGVRFTAPQSVSQIGFSTLNMLQGYIQDFSGANATMQGQPAVRGRGRSQNTASGMQTLLAQGSAGIAQVIEDLEQQFGEPLLSTSYKLLEQFFEDKIMLRILGRRGAPLIQKEVSIEDIFGDYEFKWLGSVAMRNRQILGQQMINFLNISRGLPPPVLQQMNWPWLAKKIWSEGLGLRDSEQLFNPNGYMFSVDPALEFRINKESREVALSPGDNHQEHLKQHLLDRAEIKDDEELKRWDAHISEHMQAIAQAVQQQKQQQMLQTIAALQQQGGGENGGGGRPQSMPSGLNENPMAALMSQTQGGGEIG
jgi:hypothetical protein